MASERPLCWEPSRRAGGFSKNPEPTVLRGGTHDAQARVDDDVVYEHIEGREAILTGDASRVVDVALHARPRLLEARGGEG